MILDVPRQLTAYEQAVTTRMAEQLATKSARNSLRSRYYDSEQVVQQLGIAIPKSFSAIESVIGWPQKAVDDLEQRIELEGFVLPGSTWEDHGLDLIWSDNRLALEASQAHTSALKYAVSFVSVLAGDVGEPDVIVRPLSATSTTALWDSNQRRAEAGLTLTAFNEVEVTEFILFTAWDVVTCRRENGAWTVERVPHRLGRAPIAVLPFKPSLEQPFGKSRITRAVMSITDRAVRTLLRTEVSAEFYSTPQRWVVGAAEGAFVGPNGEPRTGWEVTIGKLLALDATDEEQQPRVGQFPQMTMQPHIDMVRMDAAMFSGETGIPVDTLGVIHDNPSSGVGVQARYTPLIKTAERARVPFGIGWVDAMQMAAQVRDGVDAVPDELRRMEASFRPAHLPTVAEASDAMLKQVQAIPWIAESDVALERLGYSTTEIDRLLSTKRRAVSGSLAQQLLARAGGGDAVAG